MFETFLDILLSFSSQFGYFGIFFLMTIESSFVPFPSEIVIPPAAYLASTGQFNIYLVIICGIIGSLAGAAINYWLSYTLGRQVIYKLVNTKLAKLFLLDEAKIKKAEKYFLRYGKASTFFGRLVPVVRQLISIPAGFSKMNFGSFMLNTALGSGIWVIILAILGYALGSNQELMAEYYKEIKIIIIAAVIIIASAFIIKKLFANKSEVPK